VREYNRKEAELTLTLIQGAFYNTSRPSSDIIEELCGAIKFLIDERDLLELPDEKARGPIPDFLYDVLTRWDVGIERWRRTHDSIPSAFVELASTIDNIKARIKDDWQREVQG